MTSHFFSSPSLTPYFNNFLSTFLFSRKVAKEYTTIQERSFLSALLPS